MNCRELRSVETGALTIDASGSAFSELRHSVGRDRPRGWRWQLGRYVLSDVRELSRSGQPWHERLLEP